MSEIEKNENSIRPTGAEERERVRSNEQASEPKLKLNELGFWAFYSL